MGIKNRFNRIWNFGGLGGSNFYKVYEMFDRQAQDQDFTLEQLEQRVLLTTYNECPTISDDPGVSDQYVLELDVESTDTVEFFYDTDRQGFDGTGIAGTPADQGNGVFQLTWNTTGLPTGDYFVYARVTGSDSVVTTSQYSTDWVYAVTSDVPQVSNVTLVEKDYALVVSWDVVDDPDLGHYLVSYTSDASGEGYEHILTAGVGEGFDLAVTVDDTVTPSIITTTIDGLDAGGIYRVAVQAVDNQDQLGQMSEAVVGVARPLPMMQTPAGQWPVFASSNYDFAGSANLDYSVDLGLENIIENLSTEIIYPINDTSLLEYLQLADDTTLVWDSDDGEDDQSGWQEIGIRYIDDNQNVQLIRKHVYFHPGPVLADIKIKDINGNYFDDLIVNEDFFQIEFTFTEPAVASGNNAVDWEENAPAGLSFTRNSNNHSVFEMFTVINTDIAIGDGIYEGVLLGGSLVGMVDTLNNARDNHFSFVVDRAEPYVTNNPGSELNGGSGNHSKILSIPLLFNESLTLNQEGGLNIDPEGLTLYRWNDSPSSPGWEEVGRPDGQPLFSEENIIYDEETRALTIDFHFVDEEARIVLGDMDAGDNGDGRYVLVLAEGTVSDIAGNLLSESYFEFHQLAGDTDGDADVDSIDQTNLANTIGEFRGIPWTLDDVMAADVNLDWIVDENDQALQVTQSPLSESGSIVLTVDGSGEVALGHAYTIDVAYREIRQDEVYTWTVDWGDGTLPEDVSSIRDAQLTYTYMSAGEYDIQLLAMDDSGTTHYAVPHKVLVNIPMIDTVTVTPDVSPTNPNEGELVNVAVSLLTASGNETVSIDWGDGIQSTLVLNGLVYEASHTYADDGEYIALIEVVDTSGLYDEQSILIEVDNVSPTIALTGDSTGTAGVPYQLSLAVTDPGSDEISFLKVDWGDGVIENIIPGTNLIEHIYKQPNVNASGQTPDYTIEVIAIDKDSGYAVETLAVDINSYQIDVLIRDFKATNGNDSETNPDFEMNNPSNEVVLDLVKQELGTDGKPIYNDERSVYHPAITSESSFNQWYNDVNGINLRKYEPLTFTESTTIPGQYELKTDYLFPIDNKLFSDPNLWATPEPQTPADDGIAHNFHYTMELHASFVYQGDEIFEFVGDDDLWIYINGVLAVDLGGLHEHTKTTASNIDNDLDLVLGGTDANELGLTEIGQTYSFDLFFAERHTDESVFEATTTILLQSQTELIEGTQFETDYQQAFVVPDDHDGWLSFTYSDLIFDTTDTASINDALEFALVDEDGISLVDTIGLDHDAFFNHTEGESVELATGVYQDGRTIWVNISDLDAGTQGRLIARLVNNDSDTTTSVAIQNGVRFAVPDAAIIVSPEAPTAEPAVDLLDFADVDLDSLDDVTVGYDVTYQTTSFNDAADRLLVDLTLANNGRYDVRGPLLLGIKNISEVSVDVIQPDGYTEDDMPYYDISDLAFDVDNKFSNTVEGITIQFSNPYELQFDYELMILGHLNDAPAITSTAPTEVIAGEQYVYDITVDDPEDDVYYLHVIKGPLDIDPNNPSRLIWDTTTSDAGVIYDVEIRAIDVWGAMSEPHVFTIEVTDPRINRPPVFDSERITSADIDETYRYTMHAIDNDGDTPIEYEFTIITVTGDSSYTAAEDINQDGLIINADTGEVTWRLDAEDRGKKIRVEETAISGYGTSRAMSTSREFDIEISGNLPPVFITKELPDVVFPGPWGGKGGDIYANGNQDVISLMLEQDELSSEQTVILNLHDPTSAVGYSLPSDILDNDDYEPVGDNEIVVYNRFPHADTSMGFPDQTNDIINALLSSGSFGSDIVASISGFIGGDYPVDIQYPTEKNDATSTGIFSAGINNPYGLSDYGIVLSTGNAGDYGSGSNSYSGYTFYFDEGGWSTGVPSPYPIDSTESSDPYEVMFDLIDDSFNNESWYKWKHYDGTYIKLDFTMEGQVSHIYFDVVFGSEEYPEFVSGQTFSDGFGIFMNPDLHNPSSIMASDNIAISKGYIPQRDTGLSSLYYPDHPSYSYFEDEVLEFDKLVGDPIGDPNDGSDADEFKPVSIRHPQMHTYVGATGNTTGSTELDGLLWPVEGDGVTFMSTPVLSFQVPVQEGDNSLIFLIADTNDGILDSTAYISGFSIHPKGYMNLDIIPSNSYFNVSDGTFVKEPAADYSNIEGTSEETVAFDVQFKGTGQLEQFNLLIKDGNRDAVVGSIPVYINGEYIVPIEVFDPDGDELSYSLTIINQDDGSVMSDPIMSIDSQNNIHWLPTAVGTYTLTVTVDDGHGHEVSYDYVNIKVVDSTGNNQDPYFTEQPGTMTVTAGLPFSYQLQIVDDDNNNSLQSHKDHITYKLINPPSVQNPINISLKGLVTWTPTAWEANKSYSLQIRADDGRGGFSDLTLEIEVQPQAITINSAPRIDSVAHTPASGIVKPGEYHRVSVNWSGNTDHDKLEFRLVNAPPGMHIDENTGDVTWVPTEDELGTFTYYIVVDDNRGGVDSIGVKVTATYPNEKPIFFDEPFKVARVNRRYYYDPQIFDPDGVWDDEGNPPPVYIRLKNTMVTGSGADQAVTFDINDGVIDFVPDVAGVTYTGIIEVTDQSGAVAELPFEIEVIGNEVNHYPELLNYPSDGLPGVDNGNQRTFTGGTIEVQQGEKFYFKPELYDEDGDPVLWEFWVPDHWPESGFDGQAINMQFSDEHATDYPEGEEIIVKLDDGNGIASYTITVKSIAGEVTNHEPKITTLSVPGAVAGQEYRVQFEYEDEDGDGVSFALINGPKGMYLSPEGQLVWTPKSHQTGEQSFQVVAVDNRYKPSIPIKYTINVGAYNLPPTINSSPDTVIEGGDLYDYKLTVKDDDNRLDEITYSLDFIHLVDSSGVILDNAVDWVNDWGGSFDSQTGEFSATPLMIGGADTYYHIQFTAIDLGTIGHSQDYCLQVVNSLVTANYPPEFEDEPVGQAEEGTLYNCVINVSDPEGTTLTLTYDLSQLPGDLNGFQIDLVDTDSDFINDAFEINWTPEAGRAVDEIPTTYWVKVSAEDGSGLSSTYNFPITVYPAYQTPEIDETQLDLTQSVIPGMKYRYVLPIEYYDGIPMAFELLATPQAEGMEIDANSGLITWDVPLDAQPGTHTITIETKDYLGRGILDSTSSIVTQITYNLNVVIDNENPEAELIPITSIERPHAIDSVIAFQVLAQDNVGVEERWIEVTLPNDSTEIITTEYRGWANITFSQTGEYRLRGYAKDYSGNDVYTDDLVVKIIDPSDAEAPNASIQVSPSPFEIVVDEFGNSHRYVKEITEPADIYIQVSKGELTDDFIGDYPFQWVLELVSHSGNIIQLASGETEQDGSAVVATVDPRKVADGAYILRLVVEDAFYVVTDQMDFVIATDGYKTGDFQLTFTDLTIPVGGIPIIINRKYDTLQSDVSGDFGYGWSLDILNVGMDIKAESLGMQKYGGLFDAPFVHYMPLTFTLPDGTSHLFSFQPTMMDPMTGGSAGQMGSAILNAFGGMSKSHFEPAPGVMSTLEFNKELAIFRQNDYSYTLGGNIPFNPVSEYVNDLYYVLTTADGIEYHIDPATGELKSIQDGNENKLEISDHKIVARDLHGNIKEQIGINRDDSGRIRSITDPYGEVIEYVYDDKGNLREVINRNDEATTLHYDDTQEHLLSSIEDASGLTVLSVEYENGQLNHIYDASENRYVDFDYGTLSHDNIEYATETIIGKEEDGGDGIVNDKTQLIRDDRGNTVRSIQYLYDDSSTPQVTGYIITVYEYVYDDDNIWMTESWESYPYEVDTITTSTPDTYDVASQTDFKWAKLTQYSRESTGEDYQTDIITVVDNPDANGEGVSNIYNSYHWHGSRTDTIIDANGLMTKSSYNAKGNLVWSKDPYGHRTEYEYYDDGSLEQVIERLAGKPDVITSIMAYHPNGTLASITDAAGLTRYFGPGEPDPTDTVRIEVASYTGAQGGLVETRTYYDGEERVLATRQYLDNAFLWETTTAYDARGQVSQTTDRFGTITQYRYDIFGNLVETRTQTRQNSSDSALNAWVVTQSVYDDQGRLIVQSDSFIVDNSDQLLIPSSDSQKRGTRTIYDKQGRVERTERLDNLDITVDDPDDDDLIYTSIYNDETDPDPVNVLSATTTAYNALGQVTSVTVDDDPGNQSPHPVQLTLYQYDGFGRQSKVSVLTDIDPNNNIASCVKYVYDLGGRILYTLDNIVHDLGSDLYDPSDDTYDDSDQRRTDYLYDQELEAEDGTVWRYDVVIGPAITMADPRDDSQTLTVYPRSETYYDELGQMIAQRDHVLQLSLAASDIFHVMTVGEGSQQEVVYQSSDTYYEYDASGRLTAVIQSAVGYDNPSGTATIMVHPRYEYDYDHYGNQIAMRDNIYHLADTQDALGRPTTAAVYDHDGTAGDDSRQTSWTYDDFNRQVTRQLPMGETETFEYYASGQLKKATSFEGYITGYFYDGFTDFANPGNASGGHYLTAKHIYSSELRYNSGTAASSDKISYEHDAFGRQILVRDSRGDNVYDYDDQGQLIRIDTNHSDTIHYVYDPVTGEHTQTLTGVNSTDPLLPPTGADINTKTIYTYDLLGRLKTVTQAYRDGADITDEVTTYHYDLLGRLVQTDLPNDIAVVNTYDDLDRLTQVVHYTDRSITPSDFTDNDAHRIYSYIHNLDGRKAQVIEQKIVSGTIDYLSATQWTYDSLGRLLTEQFDAIYDGVSFTADQTTSYTYSLTGNQLSKTTDSTGESIAYFYDANDRMTQETGRRHDTGSGVITTTIDYLYGGAAGSYTKTYLTGLSQYETGNSSNNVETTTYSYNLDGRITGVNSTRYELDGTTNQLVEVHTWYWYAYDHQGMRVSNDYYTVVGGSYEEMACHYLIDENNPTGYAQVLEETITNLNTGAKTLKTYTLGLDVIAQADDTLVGQSGGETAYLLMYDSHGSTRYLTNSTGGMVAGEIYDYEAYGDLRTGNPGITNNHTVTSHLYTGARFDATVQMYDLRGRFVRTQNGRFPSMDPYMGSLMNPLTLNKYGYCHGDPINMVDPSGMVTRSQLGTFLTPIIGRIYRTNHVGHDVQIDNGIPGLAGALRPDIMNFTIKEIAEIKPLTAYGMATGFIQLKAYLKAANGVKVKWRGKTHQIPPVLGGGWVASKWKPAVQPITVPQAPEYLVYLLGNMNGVVYYKAFRMPDPESLRIHATNLLPRLEKLAGRFMHDLDALGEMVIPEFDLRFDMELNMNISSSTMALAARNSAIAMTTGLGVAFGMAQLNALLGHV